MRIFKTIDFSLQILAFINFIFWWIYLNDLAGFLSFYFSVGSVQLLSWLIHLFIPFNTWELLKERDYYSNTLGILVLTIVVGFFLEPVAYLTALFLLIGTPGMAFYYFYITLKELKNIRKQVN